jgi:twitching motility protein PilT
MPESKEQSQEALEAILREAKNRQASDVHIVPGFPVSFRVHGQLDRTVGAPLTSEQARGLVETVLPERLKGRLDELKNVDCSISIDDRGKPCRFRANVFVAGGDWCVCLRQVPEAIPTFKWMGLPEGLAQRLIAHTNGLVVISGVTGSGKSTTLAALVNVLNQRGGVRVITVEEPIEYVHKRISSSIVTQREIGRDVDSFYDGLKYGLRQDPDVILVGEIRDPETAAMALSAAETGHLILATMHTKDAKGVVTRLADLFPRDRQDDVRAQLALSLRSVVNQHLLPSATPGEKRVLATEILHVNQPVRAGIKFGKIESIESALQIGKRDGMLTLDDDLARLATEGRISMETARKFAKDPDGLI